MLNGALDVEYVGSATDNDADGDNDGNREDEPAEEEEDTARETDLFPCVCTLSRFWNANLTAATCLRKLLS